MRKFALLLVVIVPLGGLVLLWGRGGPAAGPNPTVLAWPAGLPVYDHVVIVVEENKDVDAILDKPEADYINSVLRKEGANFTNMFGEEHNSEGNYFWLFSGSNHSVGFFDAIPAHAFSTPNLGQALLARGRTFKGYAEGLPEVGSLKPRAGSYARKHVPWISFNNIPDTNFRFLDFPTDSADFKTLPTVSFVIPDLQHDMHDGTIKEGDTWLRDNLDRYYQWAKVNNSLLILTFDENDVHGTHITGLTDPFTQGDDRRSKVKRNQIVTIFAGARIKPGNYEEGKGITHVNILRTLEAMYGLPKCGAQQPKAAAGGISDDFIVTDVFKP
jgi:hypothetical protein